MHKKKPDVKRILRILTVGCMMLFLLSASVGQETRRRQYLELVGYWMPENIPENRHSFFPDDSSIYVPWHTDDGGKLSGIRFLENGEVYVALRYEKNGFSDNEWVLGGRFSRDKERLVIHLYLGIDKPVYCRYYIIQTGENRLILQKAYPEDGMWLPIYVNEYLWRNGE